MFALVLMGANVWALRRRCYRRALYHGGEGTPTYICARHRGHYDLAAGPHCCGQRSGFRVKQPGTALGPGRRLSMNADIRRVCHDRLQSA